jgi:hypothetical protein
MAAWRQSQAAQEERWAASQTHQDRQLAAIALALRQYGVLIDALREGLGLSDADWEAAVQRAIDRVEAAQEDRE